MAVMSIRNVSPVLMKELKAEAARRGVTLREHVIAVLTPGHLDKIFETRGVTRRAFGHTTGDAPDEPAIPGGQGQSRVTAGPAEMQAPREPLWKDKSKKKLV